MFNTYFINLESCIDRLNTFENNFKNTDIMDNIKRFDAIDGNNIKKDLLKSKTSFISRNFLPKSTIGCGISHIELASFLYKEDKNDFALVLEDDIFPYNLKLKDKILEISNDPKYVDWDIIRLFCQGFYPKGIRYNTVISKLLSGSCAAYLISKSGQKKMADKQVIYHIDTQQNFSQELNIYRQNKYQLFNVDIKNDSNQVTFDNNGHLNNASIGGVTFGYAINFPIARIPVINYNILIWHILIFLFILFIIIFILIIKMF